MYRPDRTMHPLSFQQQEMIRDMRRLPEVAFQYDKVYLFELRGDIDVDCLSAAVDDLVERHPVLRTSIVRSGVGYMQSVLHSRRHVLTEMPSHDGVDSVAEALLDRRRGTSEILSGAPLFHAQVQPSDSGQLLAVGIHHLIFDWWAAAILWKDLTECYAARCAGRRPRLPDLTNTYADYARWQHAAWPNASASAVPFWKKALAGYRGDFPWPQPRHVTSSPSTEATIESFFFPAERYPAIWEIARSCRVTPFLVLLSATAVATFRVTGQSDLLFATDTACRDDPAMRYVMGFFVNTQLTRVNVATARSFGDLVAAVGANWLAAEEHRNCHIHPILEELGERGGPTAMRVDMVHEGNETPSFVDVELQSVPLARRLHNWRDLAFQWHYPVAGGFRADVIHKPSRIDPATLTAVVDEIATVLKRPNT